MEQSCSSWIQWSRGTRAVSSETALATSTNKVYRKKQMKRPLPRHYPKETSMTRRVTNWVTWSPNRAHQRAFCGLPPRATPLTANAVSNDQAARSSNTPGR